MGCGILWQVSSRRFTAPAYRFEMLLLLFLIPTVDSFDPVFVVVVDLFSFIFGLFFIFSYTTFSTFSYDVITWISQGHVSRAVSYVAINNVCSIGAAGLGMLAMKKVLQHTIIK